MLGGRRVQLLFMPGSQNFDHLNVFTLTPSLSLPPPTELAKGFCGQAYEMERRDEELYLVWPRVLAAMGEAGRAQTLFERALEYHPSSTRLMAA